MVVLYSLKETDGPSGLERNSAMSPQAVVTRFLHSRQLPSSIQSPFCGEDCREDDWMVATHTILE